MRSIESSEVRFTSSSATGRVLRIDNYYVYILYERNNWIFRLFVCNGNIIYNQPNIHFHLSFVFYYIKLFG